MRLELTNSGALLATFHVRPVLIDRIRELRIQNPQIVKLRGEVGSGQRGDLSLRDDGTMVMGQRLCVPDVCDVRRETMEEAHSSAYAMRPGNTKMYHTLKEHYWWKGMKRDIAEFISRCLTCQQVKAEHQKPVGLLQSLSIPQWKWERITMDFVVGLTRCRSGHDTIWVIVDRLTKSSHFLPIRCSDPQARSDPKDESKPKPGDARFISFIFRVIKFYFQKCCDPNPRPDPNGGSEPESGLLRRFHLSHQNILSICLVAETVSFLGKPIIIYKFKANR